MKKKALIIASLILVTIILAVGYRTFLSAKGVEGTKEVTIQIVVENEDINESFTFKTDHKFLYDLLEEKEEELGLTIKKYDFGPMVTGMANYEADESKNEYFHIYVNEEDATTGPKEIIINDKDNYKFELKKW